MDQPRTAAGPPAPDRGQERDFPPPPPPMPAPPAAVAGYIKSEVDTRLITISLPDTDIPSALIDFMFRCGARWCTSAPGSRSFAAARPSPRSPRARAAASRNTRWRPLFAVWPGA